MRIYSNNIIDGHLEDRFGKHGEQFLKNRKPNRSFHVAWDEVPENTESLALIFIDHDAIPVCGFSWIHWTVANIDPELRELPENASVEMDLLEGLTSWHSPIVPESRHLDKEDAIGFGGCSPPDQPHRYTIELYALNKKLDLPRGFYKNELLKAMDGSILNQATLHAIYRN